MTDNVPPESAKKSGPPHRVQDADDQHLFLTPLDIDNIWNGRLGDPPAYVLS